MITFKTKTSEITSTPACRPARPKWSGVREVVEKAPFLVLLRSASEMEQCLKSSRPLGSRGLEDIRATRLIATRTAYGRSWPLEIMLSVDVGDGSAYITYTDVPDTQCPTTGVVPFDEWDHEDRWRLMVAIWNKIRKLIDSPELPEVTELILEGYDSRLMPCEP